MNYFSNVSMIQIEEQKQNKKTSTVRNSWIKKENNYYEEALKQIHAIGFNVKALTNYANIDSNKEVDRLETEAMM